MPTLNSRSIVEVARGIKAFLDFRAGVTRGAVPGGAEDEARRLLEEKEREVSALREKLRHAPVSAENTYEALYETHARAHSAEDSVGGSFEKVGRLELEVLRGEGLEAGHTLLDLGCGTGRLAAHAIPILEGGRYIGVDISQSMLDEAKKLIEAEVPHPPCEITWVKQTTPDYPFGDGSVDVVCAFSVFTHMEHEDSFRYLRAAIRIVRPGGLFIFSCLPMNLDLAKTVFLGSAGVDLKTRWDEVRNVATSVEMMDEVSRLAGWEVVRWRDGEAEDIELDGGKHAMGQSVCVLRAPENT